jgi:hypothetical protein
MSNLAIRVENLSKLYRIGPHVRTFQRSNVLTFQPPGAGDFAG